MSASLHNLISVVLSETRLLSFVLNQNKIFAFTFKNPIFLAIFSRYEPDQELNHN